MSPSGARPRRGAAPAASRTAAASAPERGAATVWQTVTRVPAAAMLIAAMAVGSVVLWIGIPFGWLYLVSHMVKSTQPRLGPYLLVLFGIPVSMFVFGKLLWRLDRLYTGLTGQASEVRFRNPWLKSLRGERAARRRLTVLELTMIVTVSAALLAFGIWFFFFAGSSIPTG